MQHTHIQLDPIAGLRLASSRRWPSKNTSLQALQALQALQHGHA
jgi:hypothetical protein